MRRPKGDRALTGAERQAAYRQRERNKRAQAGADYSRHIYDLESKLQRTQAAADKLRKENVALRAQASANERRVEKARAAADKLRAEITLLRKEIVAVRAGAAVNAQRVASAHRATPCRRSSATCPTPRRTAFNSRF
jgi:chromosome segregation ATPase